MLQTDLQSALYPIVRVSQAAAAAKRQRAQPKTTKINNKRQQKHINEIVFNSFRLSIFMRFVGRGPIRSLSLSLLLPIFLRLFSPLLSRFPSFSCSIFLPRPAFEKSATTTAARNTHKINDKKAHTHDTITTKIKKKRRDTTQPSRRGSTIKKKKNTNSKSK